MTSVAELLDSWSQESHTEWLSRVEVSLGAQPQDWLELADSALTTDRHWLVLSWVESSASTIAATGRSELVELAAFALAVLEGGPVDGREAKAIAPLVRRGAVHAGLDFLALARQGCGRAGDRGRRCFDWLSRVSDRLYRTHREVGHGTDFRFERVPSSIDIDALTRWAKGEQ